MSKNDSKGSGPQPSPKAVQQQTDDVNKIVGKMPFNATKPSEFGAATANVPPGETVKTTPFDTASTLSEVNTTAKTGCNDSFGSLDQYRSAADGQQMNTDQGVPIATNQSLLKAGLDGPSLLDDFIFREKINAFDHERIPERVVHARGAGAHGYFESYGDFSDLTMAAPFAAKGKQTPLFLRFSTVVGERGSTDTARDVRGYSVKFYTEHGNWDIVGISTAVFFIQDAMKFPDLIHAIKPEPHNAIPQAASAHDTFWDFVSLMPESTHMLMWVMSDRAIPRSFRTLEAFGVHTFRFVNAKGEAKFIKYHFKPVAGTHSMVWNEAQQVSGANSDFHRQDLWNAIENGNYPEWEFGVQVFTEEQSDSWSFDPLDPTKLVPEDLVPITFLGKIVLNRNPDNFFAETEQVAFCPAHVIPGVDFSNDPLLAGRIHSYTDTQLHRLNGANTNEIPINAPIVDVYNNQRDGYRRQTIHRGRVAYEPNSIGGGCPFQAGSKAGYVSFPEVVNGNKVRGKSHRFAEFYQQAKLFWNSQTPVEQRHIMEAFRFELGKVNLPAIRERMVSGLRNVDEKLAEGVAKGLGMTKMPPPMPMLVENPPKPEVTYSKALSLMALPGVTGVKGLTLALIAANGVNDANLNTIKQKLSSLGATVQVIAPMVGQITGTSGKMVDVDGTLENSPAVLFDGVVILDGKDSVDTLKGNGLTRQFYTDTFRHLKTLMAIGDAVALTDYYHVPRSLPSGEHDAGLLFPQTLTDKDVDNLVNGLAIQRHYVRDTDPPLV